MVKPIFVVCLVLFLVSCRSKPEEAIIGGWEGVEPAAKLQFFNDGTISHLNLGDKGSAPTSFSMTTAYDWNSAMR